MSDNFAEPLDIRGLTLTTLRDGDVDHVGIRTPLGIIDVAAAARALGIAPTPLTGGDVIAAQGDGDVLQKNAKSAPASAIRSEASAEFGPLVANPPKILCVGLNY